MNNQEGFRSMNLKDMLQVKIKPLQNQLKISKQNELTFPVMIDIRTHNEKINQKDLADEDLTKSNTPTSQISNNTSEIDRQPLDLIFVIDLSISMRGKKMTQLRKTINNLMNFLSENDRMAIIGFNNSAQNLFPLANLTQQNKKKITQILNSILPMGLTNITVGLLEGLKQLEASILDLNIVEGAEGEEDDQKIHHRQGQAEQVDNTPKVNKQTKERYLDMLSKSEMIPYDKNNENDLNNSCIHFGQKKEERIKSIFLLSDGLDDRCQKNLDMLRARIQSMRIQFSLNTFGYGEQHDAFLMNEIAGFKEGSFYYIEDIEKTDHYFADALGGLFSVIGNQLEFDFILNNQSMIQNMTISKVYGDMWKQTQQNDGLLKNQGLSSNNISQMPAQSFNHIQQSEQTLESNQYKQQQLSNNNLYNTDKEIYSRSFSLNQIFFGVSKQILLEITIPPQQMENALELNSNTLNGFSELLSNQIIATGKLKVRDLYGVQIEKISNLEVFLIEENEQIQEEYNISNEDVEINYLRVQCAQAFQDAMNFALKNEYNESQLIINRALEQINKSKPTIQKSLQNLQKDLEECVEVIKQKISRQQASNPNSQTQLSYSSSHSTQDQKDFEQEKVHNIRRAFLCKSRAYMEQKSVMINLDEYQNNIQKNIKKQIEIQNQKKTFSAEEEEKETEKPVKAKKILIPLQRKKFSSMNVGIDEISSIDEQK